MGERMDERLVYLIPYFFVSACNWLQGPYFYAVYKTKFAPEDVEDQLKNIYICGYSMSLLSSIFAGFWTDKLGRKGASICCCMLYVCSCMSVYSNSITLLYVGRVLGGFASTLFHTAFESWLNGSDIKKETVNELFYLQTSVGGVVAILSGGIAHYSTEYFGLFGSFSVAAAFSTTGAVFIFLLWQENYGGTVVDTDKSHAAKENVSLTSVLMAFVEKKGLLLLGLVQILFEGSMHVFIMLWNPTIQNAAENDYLNVNHQSHNLKISDVKPMLPPGVTFSVFMFALMLGSHCVAMLSKFTFAGPEQCLLTVFAIASAALYCASESSYIASSGFMKSMGIEHYFTNNIQILVYFFFILYEFSVGMYFPSVAVCRSRYIPNEMRATITSMYRVPQNLFVILLLRYRSDLKRNQRLQLSATALLSGVFIMLYLKRQMQRRQTVNKKKKE